MRLKHFPLLVILALALLSAPARASDRLSSHWGDLHPKLENLMDLIQREHKAPESTWRPFKEDKISIRKDMDEIIDEAIEILNISNLSELKKELDRIRTNLHELEQHIGELKTKQLMSPSKEPAWKIWKEDQADYEKKIKVLEDKIALNHARQAEIKTEIVQKMAEIGVNITPAQIDSLLYSVTSNDDLQLIVVFDNVKSITAKLRELTVQSSENIETARRYYGMYTVLLKILMHLQDNYIANVDQEYIPAIDAIIRENQSLMKQTQRLLANSQANHRAMYQANLNAQILTNRTAVLYKNFLNGNQRRIKLSRDKTQKEYQVAENTYQTVSTAYNLLALIQQADQLFAALSELKTPELLTFENNNMRREFEKLTNRMMAEAE